MKIKICKSKENEETIVKFRKIILEEMKADPEIAANQPLDFAYYLLAYEDNEVEPVGMAEFYFFDQAFNDYSQTPYGETIDLAQFGTISEVTHLRSLIVLPHSKKQILLFSELTQAIAMVSSSVGSKYTTAGTLAEREDLIRLYEHTGAKQIGSYEWASEIHKLVIFKADDILSGAMKRRTEKVLEWNEEKINEIRKLKKEGL